MLCAFMRSSASFSVASGPITTGLTTMAALELLHLPDMLGLGLDIEIAMDDADAAGLRHGDGETGFGHRIHGRRQQWYIEFDGAGEAGANVGVGRQHFPNGPASTVHHRRSARDRRQLRERRMRP